MAVTLITYIWCQLSSPYAGLITNVQALLYWEVHVAHTLQEGNSCADLIAKEGAREDATLKIWDLPPPSMSSLLMGDSMGVSFVRSYFFVCCYYLSKYRNWTYSLILVTNY